MVRKNLQALAVLSLWHSHSWKNPPRYVDPVPPVLELEAGGRYGMVELRCLLKTPPSFVFGGIFLGCWETVQNI